MKSNIVLIGFMGVGKTTLGQELARRLGKTFLDTDEEIEKALEMSIPDIFKKFGEVRFRQEEKNMVAHVATLENRIISTGGGVVLDPENMERLAEKGIVVCLTATPQVIYQRVKHKKDRPLLQCEDQLAAISKLLQEREALYRRQAHYFMDTSRGNPHKTADAIIERVKEDLL